MAKGKAIKVTPELLKFLKKSCKQGVPYKIQSEKAYKLGLVDEPYSGDTFSGLCNRLGFNNGRTGCFQVGSVPHNKGRKQTEYCTSEAIERMRKTRFQKGQEPINHRPIGSERVNVDGYVEVKVAEPKKWMLKQRYLWEKYHNEKLGRGDLILFLDGNRNNFDVSNLRRISRKELAMLNHEYGDIQDVSVRETALNIVKLRGAIYDKSKR